MKSLSSRICSNKSPLIRTSSKHGCLTSTQCPTTTKTKSSIFKSKSNQWWQDHNMSYNRLKMMKDLVLEVQILFLKTINSLKFPLEKKKMSRFNNQWLLSGQLFTINKPTKTISSWVRILITAVKSWIRLTFPINGQLSRWKTNSQNYRSSWGGWSQQYQTLSQR
jgi:hypothetical protein